MEFMGASFRMIAEARGWFEKRRAPCSGCYSFDAAARRRVTGKFFRFAVTSAVARASSRKNTGDGTRINHGTHCRAMLQSPWCVFFATQYLEVYA
ncbi:hypothetical protein [Paraburkholderia sp. ZP32-5]|uniref:hypothetical protein n=1 Tax=Paraburkholderia sp. ZP32-5 TaxID=2883245 RepID=UPI001F392AC2|nr:hypothetical protein [Paraburkholderia sp. ZP32-5]